MLYNKFSILVQTFDLAPAKINTGEKELLSNGVYEKDYGTYFFFDRSFLCDNKYWLYHSDFSLDITLSDKFFDRYPNIGSKLSAKSLLVFLLNKVAVIEHL